MTTRKTVRVLLTAGRAAKFSCPADKSQAFLWDTAAPALALRATPTGRKTYVFESRLNGATVRIAIGSYPEWGLEDARRRAGELKRLVDDGIDPRELERDRQAAAESKREAESRQGVTVGEAWAAYVAERRPYWGDLHYRDHVDKARPGGVPSKARGASAKITRPGPLAALMPLPLRDLDAATVEAWAAKEGQTRPASARLAWRLLTVFLTWCSEQPAYASLLPDRNPGKTRRARESLGKPGTKSDVLQRGQLAAWFAHVRQLQSPTIAAALQVMLLTGARPGEVLSLQWQDVDTQWKGLTIRDKVEGLRVIPATPYVLHQVAALPRRNEWVFSSARAISLDAKHIKRRARYHAARGTVAPVGDAAQTSESGRIVDPSIAHHRACVAAGLGGLTLHGLRRSFASLTEWLEVPAGVVAQIMGHKPSAIAEKHYIIRPLELLRGHHERIEAWILEQAGIQFDAKAAPGALRVVAG